jgi:fermentation-respiration switch protein FrsA (DUF1100 family)
VVAALLVLLVAAAAFKLLVVFLEPRLVFFPFAGEDDNPSSEGITYRSVELVTPDGERLTAWQLEPEHPIADVVYFHGNGGNLSVWLPIIAELYRSNLRVLAIDYRGYGLSTGRPSEQGLYRDGETAAAYARRERSGVERPLVYWGRSLGGTVAAAASRTVAPDGLILESTFPDKAAVIRANPVLRTLNVFSNYRFSIVDTLKDFTRPVLVMHGDRDSIVPFAAGRELFDRLGGPKRFALITGGDHNDTFAADDVAYWEPVREFIASLTQSRGPRS